MKKLLFILYATLIGYSAQAQGILISRNASLSFFSSTPVEDIEAKSNQATSVLDPKTRDIIFKVSNTTFEFPKKLMQEHFNEEYIESDKFPYSEFKGKIKDEVDLSKNGTYTVTVAGTLNLHGVTKPYETKATLIVNNGSISAKATFRVKIADHDIKVPSIVFKHIAESVDVRVAADYQPKKS
ncbi:YceI family protein [Pedobacter sp. L105]|uniref:YceI family protein n=1 Tax=Pedobacter sp. L105 TaxID=1641871 RepID=UPI00131DD1BB|nr:YceI family protein [Pedobacter sp. L105]